MKKYSLKSLVTGVVLLGSAGLAGCASVGNYTQGTTKSVDTSVVAQEAKTGNYNILASGLRKSTSPDTVLLVRKGASFNDTSGEFREYNVPSTNLENMIYNLGGRSGLDSGGTELYLPNGKEAGYFVPKCEMCDLKYNTETGQFEISTPEGDLGGGAGGGGGSGGGGSGGGGSGGGR